MKKEKFRKMPIPEIYKGEVRKKLNQDDIAQRGRANGAMNLPETDESELDNDQQEIVEACRQVYTKFKEATSEVLQQVNRKAEILAAEIQANTIPALKQQVESALKLSTPRRREIEEKAKEVQKRELDLMNFRLKNRLDRDPILPKNRINLYLQIILVVIFESAFNASIFSEASSYGIIGGVLIAGLVSGINVSAALITGTLILRYKNHIRPSYRLYGYAGTALATLVIFAFHLFTANYRDGIAATGMEQGPQAAGLSFSGVALVAVGMIIFLIGVFKGYFMADPYPGYDRVARHLVEARDESFSAEKRAFDAIETALETAKSNYSQNLKRADSHKVELLEEVAREKEILSRFADSVDNLNSECNKYLKLYREGNRHSRTSMAPAYFSVYGDYFTAKLGGAGVERIDPKVKQNAVTHVQSLHDGEEAFDEYLLERGQLVVERLREELDLMWGEIRSHKYQARVVSDAPFAQEVV